jgi:coenzyme F420-reducing hydrogenase alpha subunit
VDIDGDRRIFAEDCARDEKPVAYGGFVAELPQVVRRICCICGNPETIASL